MRGSSFRLSLSAQGYAQQCPIRAGAYGTAGEYQKTANDEILVIPMIETLEALDNLDAILDVPGIDGIYVGPGDLSFSLGLSPKLDREEPQVLQIYERLIRETQKRNIHTGIHCASPVYAVCIIHSGFRLVTIANDSGLVAKAAREAVTGVWAEAGDFR
jgi:4-hydroxy-2-oxoheptanedioate aldolase